MADVVERRTPDLVVVDLQIGSMGGMAVTMGLPRLDESAGTLPHVPVLMLLDHEPTSTLPSAVPPTDTWSNRSIR